MLMNRTEKFFMNNPIRAEFTRRVEGPLLERLGGPTPGLEVMEVGCGQGIGTEVILSRFKARFVHALDIDPQMVDRARRRLGTYMPERVKLEVADVTALPAEDQRYDAVFDFAILHHVPNWQDAVTEIRRVLKPGGRFYFQEVTSHALDKWFYRTFLEHPTENRFSARQLAQELERQGLRLIGGPEERYGGDFVYGVARREA
jgi:ubiquinone/menaquinone biosynthesis C-methylase UbiE